MSDLSNEIRWHGVWVGGECLEVRSGFLGQSLQAFHAWNPEVFQSGIWIRLDPHMNWWNMMEITFGAVAGALIGLGAYMNRTRIQIPLQPPDAQWRPYIEWALLTVHIVLLVLVEFGSVAIV